MPDRIVQVDVLCLGAPGRDIAQRSQLAQGEFSRPYWPSPSGHVASLPWHAEPRCQHGRVIDTYITVCQASVCVLVLCVQSGHRVLSDLPGARIVL